MDEETMPDIAAAEESTPVVNPIVARMREKHPDKADLPDDDMYGLADEHISGLEDYQNRNTQMNERLDMIFKANPDLVSVIMDMDAGASFEEALARNVDVEALEPQEGEPDYDKWNTAKNEYSSRVAENLAFEETLAQNKAKSQTNLQEFADENNMSPEQALAFVESTVSPILDAVAQLDISKEMLTMLYKSVTKDAEVSAAKEEGLLAGKNAKAEEIMQEVPVGDGLPKSASAMVSDEAPVQKKVGYIEGLKQRK